MKTILSAAVSCLVVFGVRGASLFDPSFVPDPGLHMRFQAMAVLGDGRIMLGGVVTNLVEGLPRQELAVARLLADGALDPAFGGGDGLLPLGVTVGAANDRVGGLTCLSNAVAMVSVHSGLILGQSLPPGQVSSSQVLRVAADGTAATPWAESAAYVKLTERPDGKFYAWGQNVWKDASDAHGEKYLALLSAEGALEREYRLPYLLTTGSSILLPTSPADIRDLTVAANGDMLLGIDRSSSSLARVSPEGLVRWRAGGSTAGLVREDSSGRITVLPVQRTGPGTIISPMTAVRYTADGVAINDGFYATRIEKWGLSTQLRDGRFLVTGGFNFVAGLSRPGIVCLLPDGSPDLRFVPGEGLLPQGEVTGLGDQPDGKIVVAGTFTNFDGRTVSGLVRLLPQNPDAPERITTFFADIMNARECGEEAVFKINRMGDIAGTNSLTVESISDTAVAGEDFVAISTNVVFLPGVRTMEVPIQIVADYVTEGFETFDVRMTPGDAGVTVALRNPTTVSIFDDECYVEFQSELGRIEINESDARRFPRSIELPLTFGNWQTPRVEVRRVEVSAREGVDFVSSGGIDLSPVDNATADGDRIVRLELTAPGPGVRIGARSNIVVVIKDDDTPAGAARGFGLAESYLPDVLSVTPYLDQGWLVTGTFDRMDGLPRHNLALLKPDGRANPDFRATETVTANAPCAVQPDGKILTVVTVGTAYSPGYDVVRLLADGRREAAFAISNPLASKHESAKPRYIVTDAEGRISVEWATVDFPSHDFVSRHSASGELLGLWEPDAENFPVFGVVPEASGTLLLLTERGSFRLSGTNTVTPFRNEKSFAAVVGTGLWITTTNGIQRYDGSGAPVGTITRVSIDGGTPALGTVRAIAAQSPTRVFVLASVGQALVGAIFDENGGTVNARAIAAQYQILPPRVLLASPAGEVGMIVIPPAGGPNRGWIRFDNTGVPANDVAFDHFVRQPDGRISATFKGQAPNGLRLEYSDDLRTWTQQPLRNDLNWDQSLMLPDNGPQGTNRFFRVVK